MNDRQSYDRKTSNRSTLRGGEFKELEENLPHTPVQAQFLQVEVFGSFDRAMRSFKNLVQKEGILSEFKERQSFEKPSDKKRRKKNEAIRNKFEEEREGLREFKPRRQKPTHEDIID